MYPGAAIGCSGRQYTVLEPLGKGSFGAVWRAEGDQGGTVAIKEISCSSEEELARVVAEGQLLKVVRQEVMKLEGTAMEHIPLLLGAEVETVATRSWHVRLVMSEVPGSQLEEVLNKRHRAESLRDAMTTQQRQALFAEACCCAGELVGQLAPIAQAFSATVYHRDITPRNIQVTSLGSGRPRFGLVDFGLAVSAENWRTQEGPCDLGGDGRYWPPSAWFVFGNGVTELRRHPTMYHEYTRCLDIHSLGLTGVQCFVQMLPKLGVASDDGHWSAKVLARLIDVQVAWRRYWATACECWQPVYDAFLTAGGFEALRKRYAAQAVHETVTADLGALRRALVEAEVALQGLPESTGLACASALFRALLSMLQAPSSAQCGPMPMSRWPSGSTLASLADSSSLASPMSSSASSSPDAFFPGA